MAQPGAYQACVVSLIPLGTDQSQFETARGMPGEYQCAGKHNQHYYYMRPNGYNIYFDPYWGWCIGKQLGAYPEAWAVAEMDGSVPDLGWKTCGFLGWHSDFPLSVKTIVIEAPELQTPKSMQELFHATTSRHLGKLQESLPPQNEVIECMEGVKAMLDPCLNEVISACYRGSALLETATPPQIVESQPQLPSYRYGGVIRDSAALKGEEVIVSSRLAYFAEPWEENIEFRNNGVGVLVIHDVFGLNPPNCKYVVDHFARQGFAALLPDFFNGRGLSCAGWPATEFTEDRVDTQEFANWWQEITSPDYLQMVKGQARDAVEFMKSKGYSKFAVVGFSWGGSVAEELANLGLFESASSVTGVHGNADSYLCAVSAGCEEMTYHTVPEETIFPEDAVLALTAAGAKVKVWEGMQHGFAVRGDFRNLPEVREAADQTMFAISRQFKKLQVSTVAPVEGTDKELKNQLMRSISSMEVAVDSIGVTPRTAVDSARVESNSIVTDIIESVYGVREMDDKFQPEPACLGDPENEVLKEQVSHLTHQKSVLENNLNQLHHEQQLRESQRMYIEEGYLKNNQELEAVATLATEQIVQLRNENEALKEQVSQAQRNAHSPALLGELQNALHAKEVEIETLNIIKSDHEKKQMETTVALRSAHASLVDKTEELKKLHEEFPRQSKEMDLQQSQHEAALSTLHSEHLAARQADVTEMDLQRSQHEAALSTLHSEHLAARQADVKEMDLQRSQHEVALARLHSEHLAAKQAHVKEMDLQRSQYEVAMSRLHSEHLAARQADAMQADEEKRILLGSIQQLEADFQEARSINQYQYEGDFEQIPASLPEPTIRLHRPQNRTIRTS